MSSNSGNNAVSNKKFMGYKINTLIAWLLLLSSFSFTGCSTDFYRVKPVINPPNYGKHLSVKKQAEPIPGQIPKPVEHALPIQHSQSAELSKTFSIVVHNAPVQHLLQGIARDANLNLDIHPELTGNVSLNAIEQTLEQIFKRISHQIDMRYERLDNTWIVKPDNPFLHHYAVDYVNLKRHMSSVASANTLVGQGQLSANSGISMGGGVAVGGTQIASQHQSQFWKTLESNVKDLLRETDKVFPKGSIETTIDVEYEQAVSKQRFQSKRQKSSSGFPSNQEDLVAKDRQVNVRKATFREAASVIVHPETGTLSIRATARQHEKIREYLDQVQTAAQRQVMIEATIIEVALSEGYKQGIEWSRFRQDGSGFSISPAGLDSAANNSIQPFVFGFRNNASPLNISVLVDLLRNFGKTSVLSSPRLSVLNNQTALLKVVENYVYFNVKADTSNTTNSGTLTSVTTTPQSVSVGLVMSVTPQISQNNTVILNIRPSISSISAFKEDPNPSIPSGIKNLVPQIRTREIESVMRINSGDIAVLGGLMEDEIHKNSGHVPWIGQIPFLGEIFTSRGNSSKKSELVILLRPVLNNQHLYTPKNTKHTQSATTHTVAVENLHNTSDAPALP